MFPSRSSRLAAASRYENRSSNLDRTGLYRDGKQSRAELTPVINSKLVVSTAGSGTTRVENGQGTPAQSYKSPDILVYVDNLWVGSSLLFPEV